MKIKRCILWYMVDQKKKITRADLYAHCKTESCQFGTSTSSHYRAFTCRPCWYGVLAITTTATRRQRERHNSHRFIKQNNKFVHVLRFFVHFFAGRYCTTTTWNYLILRFMKDVLKGDDEVIFLFLNLSAVPKKSTPGKFAYFRYFQQIGINATTFEKTLIHF